jgi:uncharacterized membrane protein
VFFKGLVTVLAVNALLVLISVPLILRKVPRNVVYGFRTRRTLTDDFVWYEVNAFFGRRLVAFAVVSAVAVFMLYSTDGGSEHLFFAATLVALAVPSLIATLQTLRFTRSLKPGGDEGVPRPSTPR